MNPFGEHFDLEPVYFVKPGGTLEKVARTGLVQRVYDSKIAPLGVLP